jgi:hypothetical protein
LQRGMITGIQEHIDAPKPTPLFSRGDFKRGLRSDIADINPFLNYVLPMILLVFGYSHAFVFSLTQFCLYASEDE